MYIIKLNEDSYLFSLFRRIRLWEPVTDASESPEMHLYDCGYKPVKKIEEASIFSSLEQVDVALNNEAIQILYPNAAAEEVL